VLWPGYIAACFSVQLTVSGEHAPIMAVQSAIGAVNVALGLAFNIMLGMVVTLDKKSISPQR